MSESENLSDDWSARIAKGMAESEAKRFFEPVEQVAHFRTVKREGVTLECKVRFAGVDLYEWTTLEFYEHGRVGVLRTRRDGTETTREAACLAAYNAAKELAGTASEEMADGR